LPPTGQGTKSTKREINATTCAEILLRLRIDVFMLNTSLLDAQRHYKRHFSIFKIPWKVAFSSPAALLFLSFTAYRGGQIRL
jgi:hypothetical protein